MGERKYPRGKSVEACPRGPRSQRLGAIFPEGWGAGETAEVLKKGRRKRSLAERRGGEKPKITGQTQKWKLSMELTLIQIVEPFVR